MSAAFPRVLSLWGLGPTHHAARLIPNTGTGVFEAACGVTGKPNNPAETTDCPACQLAISEED